MQNQKPNKRVTQLLKILADPYSTDDEREAAQSELASEQPKLTIEALERVFDEGLELTEFDGEATETYFDLVSPLVGFTEEGAVKRLIRLFTTTESDRLRDKALVSLRYFANDANKGEREQARTFLREMEIEFDEASTPPVDAAQNDEERKRTAEAERAEREQREQRVREEEEHAKAQRKQEIRKRGAELAQKLRDQSKRMTLALTMSGNVNSDEQYQMRLLIQEFVRWAEEALVAGIQAEYEFPDVVKLIETERSLSKPTLDDPILELFMDGCVQTAKRQPQPSPEQGRALMPLENFP